MLSRLFMSFIFLLLQNSTITVSTISFLQFQHILTCSFRVYLPEHLKRSSLTFFVWCHEDVMNGCKGRIVGYIHTHHSHHHHQHINYNYGINLKNKENEMFMMHCQVIKPMKSFSFMFFLLSALITLSSDVSK